MSIQIARYTETYPNDGTSAGAINTGNNSVKWRTVMADVVWSALAEHAFVTAIGRHVQRDDALPCTITIEDDGVIINSWEFKGFAPKPKQVDYTLIREEELEVSCPECGARGTLMDDFQRERDMAMVSAPYISHDGSLSWGLESETEPDAKTQVWCMVCSHRVDVDAFEREVEKAVAKWAEGQ